MATEVQLTYSDTAGIAYAGMLSDAEPSRVFSFENADAAAMLSGTFAAKLAATPELKARTLAAVTDPIAGIIIHTHARNNVLAQAGYEVGAEMPLLERGAAYMVAEQTMVVGDPVYVRVANGAGGAGATNTPGVIRKDSDTGTCLLMRGARVVAGGGTTNPPAVYFDKLVQEVPGDQVEIPFTNGSIAATTTTKIWKNRSDRHFLVEAVSYDNPTGLAASDTNWFAINIKNLTKAGTPIPAAWSTKLTGGQGALVADTYVAFVLAAALADRVVNPSDELAFNPVLTGTLTLPAGQGVIHGRYL
jgi:hypothetical protein